MMSLSLKTLFKLFPTVRSEEGMLEKRKEKTRQSGNVGWGTARDALRFNLIRRLSCAPRDGEMFLVHPMTGNFVES